MIVTIGGAGDPPQLAKSQDLRPSDIQVLRTAISEQILLCMESGAEEKFMERLRVIYHQSQDKELVAKLYEVCHRAAFPRVTQSPPIDFPITTAETTKSPMALVDLLAGVPFIDVLDGRKRTSISRGESRKDVFDRTFKPIADVASAVTVFDQYAVKNLSLPNYGGLPWLTSRFFRSGIETVEILSLEPDRISIDTALDILTTEIEREFGELGLGKLRTVILRIKPWKWKGSGPGRSGYRAPGHEDRHWRFWCRGCSGDRLTPVVWGLGGGVKFLAKETIERHCSVGFALDAHSYLIRESEFCASADEYVRTLSL